MGVDTFAGIHVYVYFCAHVYNHNFKDRQTISDQHRTLYVHTSGLLFEYQRTEEIVR